MRSQITEKELEHGISLVREHWELSFHNSLSDDEIQEKKGKLSKAPYGNALFDALSKDSDSNFLQGWCYEQGLCGKKVSLNMASIRYSSSEKSHIGATYQLGRIYMMESSGFAASASTSIEYFEQTIELSKDSKQFQQITPEILKKIQRESYYALYMHHYRHRDIKLANKYRNKAKELRHPALVEDHDELLRVKAELTKSDNNNTTSAASIEQLKIAKDQLELDLQRKESKIATLTTANNSLTNENETLKTANDQLGIDLQDTQDERDQLSRGLQSKESEITTLTTINNNLTDKNQELEESITEQNSTIQGKEQIITEKSDELQAIRDELDKLEPNLIPQRSTASSLDTNNNNVNLTTRIQALGEIIEVKANEADNAKSENEKAQETIQNQTAELKELSDLKKELAKEQKENAELKQKLQEKVAETSESSESNDRSRSKNHANSPGFFKEEERGREREHARGRRKKRRRSQPQPSQDDIEKILRLVAEGEQDKAEKLLKRHPELALCKGTVTDLSGRIFKSITVFQYALWALDWHMWKMILKYLPETDAAKQFADLENNGTEYEKHADWTPLIKALENHIELIEHNADSVVIKNHWCKKVGWHQRQLPAHAVNEYCRTDRSFDPTPEFKEKKLPRTRITSEGEWFTATYKGGTLGVRWGVLRGPQKNIATCANTYMGISNTESLIDYAIIDDRALSTLYSLRASQRTALAQGLRLTTEAADGAGPSQPSPGMS